MTRVQAKALVLAALAIADAAEIIAKQNGTDTEPVEGAGYRDGARRISPELVRLRAARERLIRDNPWLEREMMP